MRAAVRLTWARRRWLRLVVVLLPEVAAVDGGGGGGKGGGGSGGGGLSRDHVRLAHKLAGDAAAHGSVVAGTLSDVNALLKRALDSRA